jgi:uncharacterized membrane protein
MNKLKGGLILLLIFIASIYLAFFYDEIYRKIIRHLFSFFTNGKLTFFTPKKYLHFASGEFVSVFGIFITTSCFLLYRQKNRQKIINILFSLFIIITLTMTICYCDSNLKLIECTACNDGTRKIYYNDINYAFIFITSLVFGIIPTVWTEIRNYLKRKKE